MSQPAKTTSPSVCSSFALWEKPIAANQTLARILGYPRDKILSNWQQVIHATGKNKNFFIVVSEFAKTPWPERAQVVDYHAPTGEILYLLLTSYPLELEGEFLGVILLIEDVTNIQEPDGGETAILESRHRLQQRRSEELIQFAKSVAHQIRNPVATIGGLRRLPSQGRA